MTNWNLAGYNLGGDLADWKKHARLTYEDAKNIVAGGPEAAADYARESYARRPTESFSHANATKKNELLRWATEDTMGCAKAITAKGRAWYVHTVPESIHRRHGEKQQVLVVCTLVADGSAGAYGWFPAFAVETDDHGNITRYERSEGYGRPVNWTQA